MPLRDEIDRGQTGDLTGWSSLVPRNRRQHLGWGLRGLRLFFFDWLVVKQQSCAPGILCLVWSYHLPPGWGLQFCRTHKTLSCIFPWVGTRTLSQGCTTIWLFLLFLYSLPSLISNRLNPPFGTQGRSRRLNGAYILQMRNGKHTADLYSRVATQQSPAQF